jgi:hypothetical protein
MFCDVTPSSPVDAHVSKEDSVSIFRVEEQDIAGSILSLLFGGITLVGCNVGH